MKLTTTHAALLSLLLAGNAMAECVKPEVPEIADGATAEKDAFFDSYGEAKAYLGEADAFLKCLIEEDKAAKEAGQSKEQSDARLDIYNKVVEEMQAVGEKLNAEVKEFKARGAS